jgi:hypothetical protein
LQTFDFHRGFADVDHADAQSFIQFLERADQAPSIVKYRERRLELRPVEGIETSREAPDVAS